MRNITFLVFFLCISGISMSATARETWWTTLDQAVSSPAGKQALQSLGKTTTSASRTDIAAGLKEALRVGTDQVVKTLGQEGGFNLDPAVHIPLPPALKPVDSALSQIGLRSLTDDLETRMNQAAEAATPKARQLFMDSIRQMTITDAKGILTGSKDAATQYLRRTMGPGLTQEMQPLIQQAMTQTGVMQVYDSVMGQYARMPFMPDVQANLTDYVTGKALDGIFYYVAQEEAAIRTNPAKRTTTLLKKVFGK
ncbi:MAG: DUF4197 domain-containing protein [Pseudomonadota bacterium]|nr:DUF4197 domain-containing protein [Pseudomonadota bacterium]